MLNYYPHYIKGPPTLISLFSLQLPTMKKQAHINKHRARRQRQQQQTNKQEKKNTIKKSQKTTYGCNIIYNWLVTTQVIGIIR